MLWRRVKIQRFQLNDDGEVILPDNAAIIGVDDGWVLAELVVERSTQLKGTPDGERGSP